MTEQVTTHAADLPRITFAASALPASVTFQVDRENRTIHGLAAPFGVIGDNGWARWRFHRGSIRLPEDCSRVKLLRDHLYSLAVGYATDLREDDTGLWATFKVARGDRGDEILALAEDRVLDGLSVGLSFDWDSPESPWVTEDGTGVRDVLASNPARLNEISVTPIPAFDDARVDSVRASRNPHQEGGAEMPQDTPQGGGTTTAPDVPVPTLSRADVDTILAGLNADFNKKLEAMGTTIAEAIGKLPVPTQAGSPRVESVTEPPVYRLNGTGHSYVRDAWKAVKGNRAEQDECTHRLRKYMEQTQDWAQRAARFAADSTTTTESEIIPPDYRPDLYVGQLPKYRPIIDSFSRGVIENSNPFTVPSFTSATDLVDDTRTEGTPPTPGAIVLDTVTVTPRGDAGAYQVTRELVDGSNPNIDQIVMNGLRQDYADKTEQRAATLLETAAGTPGVDPTISTAGVYLHTITGDGAAFLDEILDAMAAYPFRRYAEPDRVLIARAGYRELAGAKDGSGRHLLARIAPQNAVGSSGPARASLDVDGLPGRPAWALDSAEQDAYILRSEDVWFWESALLEFQFLEKAGPANVELAVFGYNACQIFRPSGITAVAFTVS